MTGAGDAGPGRYTVVYDGHPFGARILNGEPAPGTPVIVTLGDCYDDLQQAKAERDRLAAELAAARAEVEAARDDALRDARAEIANLQGKFAASEAVAAQLRGDLALSAQHAGTTTCEGCGAPIFDCEDGKHTGDVHGCVPFVYEGAPGPCWRYRTADGMDRAWPACTLAAALDPPPRVTTGPSGTRDGRGTAADGGEGGGGAS